MTGNGGHRAEDPFVRQVLWLVDAVGGREQLARASGNQVSTRTLDNWIKGRYPRAAVTGAVRALDAWALTNVAGYPDGADAPRLIASCGPRPAGAQAGAPAPPPAEDEPVAPPRGFWTRGRAIAAAAVAALVVAGAVVASVLLLREDEAEALPTLPSTGDGTLVPETTGSLGAHTFTDPRTLQGQAQKIPPDTTVMVRCRYYAPSIPSVVPDGFWYLIDDGEWAGRWSPANSFMNGDVKGRPTLHNTDFAVPVCR